MVARKGSLVVIKIGDGGETELFTTLGGLRLAEYSIANPAIDNGDLESGNWRTLHNQAGNRSLSITASGIFTDSASEETLRGDAFSGAVRNYQLEFGNNQKISGAFLITALTRNGPIDGEQRYTLSLASNGPITFTAP